MDSRTLSIRYRRAHDAMRDAEGLLPQEAFDELLKLLLYKEFSEAEADMDSGYLPSSSPEKMRDDLMKGMIERVPWTLSLWPHKDFQIKDKTLMEIQDLLSDVQLRNLPMDVRSTALSTFISSSMRRGLGIYPTPDVLAKTMVEVLSPQASETVLDPACGTGTFLLETARFIRGERNNGTLTLKGVEKNPRILLLSILNLGNDPGIIFQNACADSLQDLGNLQSPLDLSPNSVDVILTNPPFGVTVSRETYFTDLFGEKMSRKSDNKIPSEILFTKLCLHLLRPGGRLGIILPRSVITNERSKHHRREIDEIGYLTSMIDLPPETFALAGTQTATVAAFFRKHSRSTKNRNVSMKVFHVSNVGFDSTGRHREGNQLIKIPEILTGVRESNSPNNAEYQNIPSQNTLQLASQFLFRRNGQHVGKALGEFIKIANTGKTPSRKSYTDSGVFILKVGNLTGRGIDWMPRERNFIPESVGKKLMNSKWILDVGDIVLTASAHSSIYIAKKVDIIADIPPMHKSITFVGELLRVRAHDDVDPFVLLAALRHPRVQEDLQASVRGQTAHLAASDLMNVMSPCDLRTPDEIFLEVADLLRSEAETSFRLNRMAETISTLLSRTTSI